MFTRKSFIDVRDLSLIKLVKDFGNVKGFQSKKRLKLQTLLYSEAFSVI